MSLTRVVAFSASANRPSRTRHLVEAVAQALSDRRRIDLTIFDLVDAGPGLGATRRDDLSPPARHVIERIEDADALIVGSPVYQGSYSGLFKHVFDFTDPARLAGKPVALTATGGGLRHSLVVEHALRPLFGFFAALAAPTAIYAAPDDFEDGAIVDAVVAARIDAAARELDMLIEAAGRAGLLQTAMPEAR